MKRPKERSGEMQAHEKARGVKLNIRHPVHGGGRLALSRGCSIKGVTRRGKLSTKKRQPELGLNN